MGLVKMSIATLLGFDKLPQALQQVLVAVESELLTQVNTTVSATESHVEEAFGHHRTDRYDRESDSAGDYERNRHRPHAEHRRRGYPAERDGKA